MWAHGTPVTSLYWQLLSTASKQYRAAQEIKKNVFVCVCESLGLSDLVMGEHAPYNLSQEHEVTIHPPPPEN